MHEAFSLIHFPLIAQQILPPFSPPFSPFANVAIAVRHTPSFSAMIPPGSLPHFLNSQQFCVLCTFITSPFKKYLYSPLVLLFYSLKQSISPSNKKPSIPKFFYPSAARPCFDKPSTRRFPSPSHKGFGFVGILILYSCLISQKTFVVHQKIASRSDFPFSSLLYFSTVALRI